MQWGFGHEHFALDLSLSSTSRLEHSGNFNLKLDFWLIEMLLCLSVSGHLGSRCFSWP